MMWALIVLPLAAGVMAARSRHAPALSVATLGLTVAFGSWAATTEATSVLSWGPRLNLTIAASDFGRVMVVLVPVIALPIVLYASATERTGRTRLIALLTVFVGAMELLVLANDLLTLLIGWELVGALSWILIAHDWRKIANVQKASHAFITTRLGDLGLYVAAGIAFASTGSFAFSSLGSSGSMQLQVIAAGIVLAAAAKSAQVPFSPWLFSAMAGPTPVSALLHSSTMVAAGAYLLVRLSPHLDPVAWFGPVVIAIGLTSALGAGVIAAVHRHPKRLLAASTTAQYGLMFVAVGAASPFAAGSQLVTHAGFKSLLFLTAGTAIHAARSEDLSEMRLGRRLPLVAAFAAIGALALAALPPLGGAWSKEQIAAAAFEFSSGIGALVLVASFLGAFYAARYWLLAFAPGSGGPGDGSGSQPAASMGPLVILSLGLGILWIPAVNQAVEHLGAGDVAPAHAAELAAGVAAAGIGAGWAFFLGRRKRLVQGLLPLPLARPAAEWFGIEIAARRLLVDPILAMARALAAFDYRIVDAGVRASARIAGGFSRLLHRRWEPSLDGVVNGVARATLGMAIGTGRADDEGIDRTIESLAAGVGRTGHLSRKLQTGLSHHYYAIVALGLIVLAAALGLGAS